MTNGEENSGQTSRGAGIERFRMGELKLNVLGGGEGERFGVLWVIFVAVHIRVFQKGPVWVLCVWGQIGGGG